MPPDVFAVRLLRQLFSLVLPITAAGIIPFAILPDTLPAPLPWPILGGVFMATGLATLALTVRLFIRVGRGTLAPWDPTRKLVALGPYRYVRNPMITGVLAIIIGEALVFASPEIGIWAAAFFVLNHLYFVLSEEPGLVKRFGQEYNDYKRAVPRWIPRWGRGTPMVNS